MGIQVYAKTGVTISAGKNFVFTGVGGGEFWEVDIAPAGVRPHGVAQTAIDEFNNYDALYLGAGPVQVPITMGLSSGDAITPDGTGKFKKRSSGDVLAGQCLLSGTTTAPAFLFSSNDAASRGTAMGSTSAPTQSSSSFAVIPEMSLTLTTRGGDVLVRFNGTFNLLNLDNWDVAIFVDGVEYNGTRRTAGFTSAAGALGLVLGTLDGMVTTLDAFVTGLAAGSHTFTVQWKKNAGTARAIGTQRRLDCVEIL